MRANNTLDRLASQISAEERRWLLEKIKNGAAISMEPLYAQREKEKAPPALPFEEQYKRLLWLARLFYFVNGFFTGRSAAKAFEDRRMLLMARGIEADSPGVFDYRKNRLRHGFYASLVELRDAARFFHGALGKSISKDRGAFYATLGSLEMEDVHRKLQSECSPQAILAMNPHIPPSSLRHAVMEAMDETLRLAPDSARGAMYRHARSLGFLRDLSCFFFDRFIMAFSDMPNGRACSISPSVKEMMIALDRILFSLRDPPLPSLIDAFFVRELEERAEEPGFDVEEEMSALLAHAGKAISAIRRFNARVPLTRMIRCATGNMAYSPSQTSGGEDWFQVYRGHWKRRLEEALARHFSERRRSDIVESLEDFFETRMEPLAHAASDSNPNGFPLPEAFALSFLSAYHRGILNGKIKDVLRLVVMEGEFAKREDRIAMTEAYNDVMAIAERVRALDGKISVSGEHGKRHAQARHDTDALHARRRKMQIVQNEASREAWEIIAASRAGMKKIGAMLEGILGRELNLDYGGISNFDRLAGKKPALFVKGVKDAIRSLKQALKVLNDLGELLGESQ